MYTPGGCGIPDRGNERLVQHSFVEGNCEPTVQVLEVEKCATNYSSHKTEVLSQGIFSENLILNKCISINTASDQKSPLVRKDFRCNFC